MGAMRRLTWLLVLGLVVSVCAAQPAKTSTKQPGDSWEPRAEVEPAGTGETPSSEAHGPAHVKENKIGRPLSRSELGHTDDEHDSDNAGTEEDEDDFDLNEPAPTDAEMGLHPGNIPKCIIGCMKGLEKCRSLFEDGPADCACAEAAAKKCQPAKHCDKESLVNLEHLKSELCGLPIDDPKIQAARNRLVKTGEPQKGPNNGEHQDKKGAPRHREVGEEEPGPVDAPDTHQQNVDKALAKCSKELEEVHSEHDQTTARQDVLLDTMLTLGGMVPKPKDSKIMVRAGDKALRQYIRKQVETLTAESLKMHDDKAPAKKTAPKTARDKELTQQLGVAGKLLRDAKKQLSHQTRDFDQLKEVFLELISQVESKESKEEREREHLIRGEFWKSSEVIEKLHEAIQGGAATSVNIREEGWAEFLEQLILHESKDKGQDPQFDPVKMGITYGIAIVPALLLLCLSRFQTVKDLFILQGIFFNSMLSGIFALLAVLSIYCNFNPMKVVLGHHHTEFLPDFELMFMSFYMYVAACNILLLFLQPRATEKLHAFFSLAVGAHLFWMLYTLRQEDTGFQHVFYLVYFVCFAGCTCAKLRQVAVMHLTHVRKGKKVKAVKDEEKGGAVFELGDDTETDNLVD